MNSKQRNLTNTCNQCDSSSIFKLMKQGIDYVNCKVHSNAWNKT